MTLIEDEGHISSVITQDTGVGSVMCPWKIALNPGQRINITLYDYAIPTEEELHKSGGHDPSVCYQYALITERRCVQKFPACSGWIHNSLKQHMAGKLENWKTVLKHPQNKHAFLPL